MLALVNAWSERHGMGEVTPKQIRALAEEMELFTSMRAKRTEMGAIVAFGKLLQRHTDTPVGKWIIRHRPTGHLHTYWLAPLVREAKDEPENDPQSATSAS